MAPLKALRRRLNKAARVIERRKVGKLADSLISPSLRLRYETAVARYFSYVELLGVELPADGMALDMGLCDFIEHLWENGEPRAYAGDVLSGMGRLAPLTRRESQQFPLAWSYFTAWGKHELPERAAPFSMDMIMAIAGYLLQQGKIADAVIYLLSFHCILRIGECLGLKAGDLLFSDSCVVLSLGFTKGGKRRNEEESVVCSDAFIIALLRILVEDLLPGDKLFEFDYNTFRRELNSLLIFFHLEHLNLKSHSLRRGGATYEFRNCNSYDTVCERGRWSNLRTCRIYLAESVCLMNNILLSPKQVRRISKYVKIFDALRV
jgi:integrase